MRKSTNYGLKLMEGTDNVKRQDFVDNFEIIDREMKNNDTSMKEIANKVDNIKIADGTTTTKGIVKLNNATNSTSQAEAATPLAVKTAMDKANEAFQYASNGKSLIAGKVGNVTGSNTHTEIANRIQTDKNTAANNLNNKGVSASGNEDLASLVSKIANITVTGMGGKEFVIGNTRGLSLENKTKFNVVWGGFGVGYENEEYYANVQLGFNPSIFIAYGRAGDGDDYDKATCSTVINNICFFSTATGNSTGGYGNLYQPKYLNGVFTFPTRPNRNLTYIAFK
ncbi:phage tail protein [Clostridium botulinum]|uniref:phage tail protein n=1 Tax=Clostridium botulinum TaxID=1491 RepID=UPI00325FAF28